MKDRIVLLTGNANPALARAIAKHLKQPLGEAEVTSFTDSETRVRILEDIRGGDIFIVQPTGPPANQNLMELLIMIDAVRRASPVRITAVLPYFGYAQQDRKDQPRVPITAKLVANLLTTAGADRVLTLDLHTHQIQGFFDIPLDHLYAMPVFTEHFKKQDTLNKVIAAPDIGSIKMARGFATRLGADLVVVDKRRISDRQTEVMHVLGDVEGRDVILVDDIIETAGSLTEAAAVLKKKGAKSVYAAVTHAVLSGPALERLENSAIEKLWVTDSIAIPKEKEHKKVEVVSVAKLFAEAIRRIHHSESISSLFH
jgi:ribose-phosphate pyrophosphokinase